MAAGAPTSFSEEGLTTLMVPNAEANQQRFGDSPFPTCGIVCLGRSSRASIAHARTFPSPRLRSPPGILGWQPDAGNFARFAVDLWRHWREQKMDWNRVEGNWKQ